MDWSGGMPCRASRSHGGGKSASSRGGGRGRGGGVERVEQSVAMDSSGMRKRLCLILVCCDTDLERLIREDSENGASPLQSRRAASQACSAVRHLHAAGLVHMDLAAKNILVKWHQPGLTGGGASG